jgi:hypothetical protein
VVSLPDEADSLDETAKSSKDDGALQGGDAASQITGSVLTLRHGVGPASALEGIVSLGSLEGDWGQKGQPTFLVAS